MAERLEADHQTEVMVHYQAEMVIDRQTERLGVDHQAERLAAVHQIHVDIDGFG